MPSRKWRAFFCPKDSVRSFGARFARPGMFAKDVRARRRTTMGLVVRKQISVPFIMTFGGKGLRLLQSSLPAAGLTAIRLRCLPICGLPAQAGANTAGLPRFCLRQYARLARLSARRYAALFDCARRADVKMPMQFPSAQIFRFLLQLIEQVQRLNGRHCIEA